MEILLTLLRTTALQLGPGAVMKQGRLKGRKSCVSEEAAPEPSKQV